jgi:hypothetical protein
VRDTVKLDLLLRRTRATALGPVRTQVSGHAEVSASYCHYPWLSASSVMQRARDLLIRRSGHIVQDRPLWSLRWADIPQLSAWDAHCPAAWLQPRALALILERLLFRRRRRPSQMIGRERDGMLSCVRGRGWSLAIAVTSGADEFSTLCPAAPCRVWVRHAQCGRIRRQGTIHDVDLRWEEHRLVRKGGRSIHDLCD